MSPLPPIEAAALRAPLLTWYTRHQRPLPWRMAPSPWRIWVSEIMCQQTRVASVIPYFERFISRFPSPAALADAPLEAVLPYWAGLGYYARVRHLHAAARRVVAEHGGQVPAIPEAFRALPGVGAYTCGAVMSIAFGLPEPILDGNVTRVLCRLQGVAVDPRLPAIQRGLWASARALVTGPLPGDLNQALMELGATVCTPKSPACLLCPLQESCVARASGDPQALPRKAPRPTPRAVTLTAALTRDVAGRIWLARNPDTGLLGGQWRLPAVEGSDPAALATLGLRATSTVPAAVVRHRFTHLDWTVRIHLAEGIPTGPDFAAFAPEVLDDLPLGGPALKGLRALGFPLRARRGAGRPERP